MNKDLQPRNAKGQRHGYWVYYFYTGNLFYNCVFINGKENGFEKVYWDNDGKLTTKNYYL